MRSRNVIITALSLIAALSAHALSGATASQKAAKVAEAQIQQSSSGRCSPNISGNSGQIQISLSCPEPVALRPKARMTSLEINQERLLLAQNPTELRITNAYLQSWLPDRERMSLTLEFENPRGIPIPEIEIDFLDPESGASIPMLKPIPFTRSQVYREAGSNKFSLVAGGKTALPVAFLDEIIDRHSPGTGLCAFDAAVTLDAPASDRLTNNSLQPNAGASRIRYKSLLVRARFKSIFNQQFSSTHWVWIVYGQGSDGAQFWYPSKKIWNTLNCAL